LRSPALRVAKLVSQSTGRGEALGSTFGSDQQRRFVGAREAAVRKRSLDLRGEIELLFGGWRKCVAPRISVSDAFGNEESLGFILKLEVSAQTRQFPIHEI